MKKFFLLLSFSALAAVLNGCVHGGAYEPKNTTKYNLERASKFVALDAGVQKSVTCPGIQEGRTTDGRLKILAQLRNRENRRIEVQANCVFKDAQGFTVDDTPFRTVILDENATETVAFECFNKQATNYTVRVRQAR